MSSSGYRGRNFGPRGTHINGPTNGFNGPRFPHPSFNHPRPLHRLSGPDKWIERANFAPWQQNKNFLPHPQYRGNLQFRPNNRGRTTGRGILRFSGPGRPSTAQFCMGFIRNPIHRPPLLQEEQDGDKPILISQTPLLGSEEERQQKILETADKLKQKLSSITEEELTNFWEDDLSVLPNNSSEEENIRNKGIPELSHEPPELDLTFTDFRDIGRVDCINSKFENVDSKSNNEISISFEQKSTDNVSTNDKITIIDENNKEKSLIILDSMYDKDNLLKNDKCYEQIHHDLTNFECNEKNLHFQNNNVPESLITSTSNNINEKSSNLLSIESVNDSLSKKSPDVNNIESILVSTNENDDNKLKIDFLQNQNIVQVDTQSINENITQDININVQHNDNYVETKLFENNQIQNNLQTNISQEISYKNLGTISDSQNRLSNFSSSSGEIYSNITCDSTSTSPYSNYNDSSIFQSRIFNIPLRFTPRIGGSKCHWTFQQNGKNLFFRGSQRLSFHGNQISSPRRVASFKSTDLIPVEFDPRAPPPSSFMHNVPISNHEFQQTAIVSFNNLPPTFNPNAPPPNIRPKSNTELSQEWLQPISSLDLRGQAINTQSNLKIIQPSSVFDPRRLPPRISNIPITINEKVSEFNPQQPPPKIHRREKTLQPPPIFDPRLSFQERSNLIAPLNISRSNMIPFNLIETSPVSDFKISPVTQNFSQPPPINISSHQTFISNVQVNFQSVVSQTSNEQEIIREFSLPLPPISITELPPPPPLPKEPLIEKNSNPNQNINMDDGLEDMQEAMEFAKQIMNLSEEIKNNDTPSTFSELSLTPSKIPIPNEISSYHSLSIEETNTNITKKQKKKENKNKKCRQNVIYGPELIFERQEDITTIDEKQNLQNQNKKTEDILLSNDQIRPKVIFNLNSKTKRIHKPEDWHKISINISDNKEISQQKTTQNSNKEKDIYNPKKHYEIRNNQNKNQQKEIKIKKNSIHSASLTNISHEKSNDTSYHYKNYTKDIEKLKAHSSNMITFNNIITPKNQITNSKKESKKQNVATSESLWKNRVISRFLKMSKNDICNMVNNSSLRKFDIVMRHLVKERRSSLSLELRNTEDEKMKEYDREEFMNQLNAMLDPSTVVGITDLPTEFIHHLSEVLQLDPMPFDIENQNVNDEIEIINQNENLKINTCEYANEENLEIQSFTQQPDSQNIHEEKIEDNFLYNNEESIHYSLNTELNLNTSQEDTNLSHRSISNNINSEIENVHKKQPLFNEADLDDILSEVTEKTKNLPNTSLSIKSEKFIETCTGALSIQRVTKTFDSNIFSQIPTKTEADLDVIFSAGIARVKQLGKNKINLDNLRASKSNFEDRNTFKSERYERWNRKEDPDTFRNLTKEEWEAKYGIANIAISPTIIRKNVFNSDENLIKDKNCSSDSPMRYLSISPLTREISTYNVDKCISDPDEIEELQNIEGLESNGESSLTSSSDTDEETVASNVTKLLKVIKEKEKIAKKKSLNETIRDEITAEIEKKWKEKSKHKEKKSRKHGKRKKDKKDKRRREKRKKKKRSCYSDSSKFSEKIERSRLLTKDEIKKEVIIKQEQTKSEENASFNNEINNTMINKVVDLQIESQCLQIEKEQLSTVTNTTPQSKNKSDIPMLIQPKTKAQLKQMPESNNTDQMHIMKKTIEITNNKTNNEKIKDFLDMNKDNEIKNNNELIDTVSYTNFSLHQIHVSVNKELPSSIQSHVKTISNDTADITSFKSFNYNTLNSVTNLNINNQNVGQKICTNISSAENKSSGYKKIDIKAYKERALQRRLKEQTISKENPVNSISFIQESHHVLPVNESNVELLNVIKEMKTNETDINELKDPRLRIRSISTPSLEDSDKEIKQKISLNEMDVVQKNEKSLIPVQLENPNENNIIHPINSDLNIFKDSIKYKKCRNDNKCSSQIITIREFDEFRKKEKSKFESEKKTPSSIIDFFKFKNIRSEGSKELKLKKEKSKRSAEKKKKDSKPNESRSLINEKSIEKYSYKKISENDQESLILNSHTNDQIEIKKINNDINENLCSIQTTETCSKNIKGINDVKTIQEQINTNSIVKQKNQQSIDNKESINIDKNVTLQVNKEIITENQQIINQNLIETKDNQSLISSEEKNNIKKIEKHTTEINKLHTISTESENLNLSQYLTIENLDIEKDTYSEISSIGLTFFSHTPSIEKHMENTILVSNHISKESHPLIEQIDVDIQKNDHSINVKLLKNVKTYNESISDTKMDSETIVKNDTNGETNDEEEHQDKLIFQLKTSENHNKVVKNETKSPDSPSSPFKGFFADTICENDICRISQLCNTKIKNESNKKNVIVDSDQLETCFIDRSPIVESAKDYRNNTRSFFKKMKKDNEITLINNLVKEKQNIQDKTIDNNSLNMRDEVDIIISKTENTDVTKNKNDRTYNFPSEQKKILCKFDIENHTFNEDTEPFIVLDEYIDNVNEKSIEKFSTLDLDFEDCIARDANIFTTKSSQIEENSMNNIKSPCFDSIIFNKVSENIFDKKDSVNKGQNHNNITSMHEKEKSTLSQKNISFSKKLFTPIERTINITDIVSSTSELNTEESKMPNIIEPIDSIISDISIECSQNIISTTSKDISQKAEETPESSAIEMRIEKENHNFTISENNSQHNLESLNAAVTFFENKTSEKLNILTEDTNALSENLSHIASISETIPEKNTEFLVETQEELDHNSIDQQVLVPFEIKMSNNKNASIDSAIENEASKNSNKTISKKLNKKKRNIMLNNIKNKSRMHLNRCKHKKQKHNISKKIIKEVIKSDTIKITYPTTKAAIMARMIEIDVEIHKLMTEKMTLYKMLTSGTLPNDDNLQQNNVTYENEEVGIPVNRPQTPSMLMSQLIQNIETNPITNQCAKTNKENLSIKDIPNSSIQSNKFKILHKHDHYTDKKESCTYNSDDEITCHTGAIKSLNSTKRKRKKSRLIKKLENKLNSSNSSNISNKDIQNTITEKIKVNDITHLTSQKINIKQGIIQEDSDQISMNEIKSQEDMNKICTQQIELSNKDKIEMLKYQEIDKIIESTESQISIEKNIQTKIQTLNEKNYLIKDNERNIEILSKKNINNIDNKNNDEKNIEKSPENRTPERSSIYSDDSTWDTLLQNSSVDDQKKPTTGLALLEETYKKEMAKTRRIKAEARKKKKKKLQNLLQSVNVLTPDEEELPLSILYIKKLHQKKKLLDSLEQQMKQQTNHNSQLWKNVVEVINVAKNKTENLESFEKQSIEVISHILNSGKNAESNENKEKQVVDLKSRNTEFYTESLMNHENRNERNNNSKQNNLQILSNKSQEFFNNKHFQTNLEINASSKIANDLSEISVCDTYMNTKENLTKSSEQQTMKNNNIEINQMNSLEDSNSCFTESNLNNIHNNQNISNASENSDIEKVEKKTDKTNMEFYFQKKLANIDKNITTQELINNQLIITSEDIEKNYDTLIESNDKNIIIINEKEKINSKVQNVNEEKLQDDKDNNTIKEYNNMYQDEHFISLKEHKEQHNKHSSEENNNQKSVSSFIENIEESKSDIFGKKLYKRKRRNNKTPLRRSSRNAEESAKRIKLEVDIDLNAKQEEKNSRISPNTLSISLSPCEEIETIFTNPKKNHSIQKPIINRKRCTPMSPEIEILSHESNLNNESIKAVKKYKKHTMSEMMNCIVRVVDCKHTILNPTISLNLLQKYGISRINTNMYSNSSKIDFLDSVQSTSTKDILTICTKQTSLAEFSQTQTSKLIKTFDDTTRSITDQINLIKIKKISKSVKNSLVNDKEEHINNDTEIMPILIKEPNTMDNIQNCDKPDIEIVEEKMKVIKNQQYNNCESTSTSTIDMTKDKELPRTQYTVHKGPILDIKVFENSFLAASEDGRIYRYNQASNGILNIYKGHKAAVTCLYVYNANNIDINKEWMFSGSLDGTLRCYNIMTGIQIRDTADISSPIQCMDEAWGIIFIGTKSGHVSRYHMKSGVIKGNSIQFSDKSVLALKATNEGPRRVLIVASRNQPITIRDAQNGLFLRTICGQKSHTVYSLMRDYNLIYCGTSSTSIPVFDFTNGEQTMQYNAGVGIVCMRLYKQLLFAGCYDGNIYVFDTKDHRLVCSIPGPGNMLLSMEVIDNKIIAGSKDKRLQSWQMPRQVLSLLLNQI